MTRIQLRHDTATNWTTANPILAEGEVGVETDTNKIKIGDGVTSWNSLDYFVGDVDLSSYYTKTQTDGLLEDKEDKITAVNPLTLTKTTKSNLEGFTYATETTVVPDTYVTNAVNEGDRYPVDTLNPNHLSSSYILMPFHNDYVYKIPLEVQYPYSSIMFGYFEEGVWVPVIQVHGPGTAVYYYKPSTTFTYQTAYNGNYFSASSDQSYNSATAYNTEDVTPQTQEIIDSYTGAIQLHIVDTADSGTDNFAIDLLHYTNTNKTSYTARTLVWSSQTQAEDRAHLNKITHIAILPTQLSMPSNSFFSTTSLGMYEYTGRLGWTPTAFFTAIDGKENLYDLAGSSAQNYLELNLGDGLTVTNNLLTTTMNANDYYTKTQVDTLLNNKVGSFVNLFDCKWADHKLNEISWLEASTFSWQSGDVYTSAYNHLVQDIQGITAETETIGSYTVTFYRATDGHKICLADQEQTVLNIYNTYGIAWYYILDTTNTQFKLPRTKYGFEGLRTNVGDKIDESLPNITGKAGYTLAYASMDGAFYRSSGALSFQAGSSGAYEANFDASRSSSTYQNNAPVQERATQMYLYFYVGDYTQTAVEQTAGLNAELFNNKVDLNFDNMNPSQTAKDTIIGWGMPDFSSRITIPYNTSIQLPCDAVVYHEDYSDTYESYCKTDVSLDGTNWVTIGNWGWTCMGSSYTVLPKGIYVKCTGKNSTFYTAWYAPLKGAN